MLSFFLPCLQPPIMTQSWHDILVFLDISVISVIVHLKTTKRPLWSWYIPHCFLVNWDVTVVITEITHSFPDWEVMMQQSEMHWIVGQTFGGFVSLFCFAPLWLSVCSSLKISTAFMSMKHFRMFSGARSCRHNIDMWVKSRTYRGKQSCSCRILQLFDVFKPVKVFDLDYWGPGLTARVGSVILLFIIFLLFLSNCVPSSCTKICLPLYFQEKDFMILVLLSWYNTL